MRKLLALIVFVVAPAIGLLWYQGALKPVDASSTIEKVIQIPKGASTSEIAALLKEQGFIKSETAFKLYTRFNDVQSALQAGGFALKPSMTLGELIEVLTKGKGKGTTVTIPEGYTVRDIDAVFEEYGLPGGAIESCAKETCELSMYAFLPTTSGLANRGGRLEGYLFPDTYGVDPANIHAEKVVTPMLENFRTKVVEGLADDLQNSKRSLHDIVTMASLIEEEAISDEERPVIAGILWKRFDEGMGLGVDAAVRYIQNKPTGALTVADLNVDSPYNLRKFRGLPPGPIANPGLKSIEAAIHPQDSQYWYYLHDPKGQIHYAITNEEHNINKAEYLR